MKKMLFLGFALIYFLGIFTVNGFSKNKTGDAEKQSMPCAREKTGKIDALFAQLESKWVKTKISFAGFKDWFDKVNMAKAANKSTNNRRK